MWRAMEMPQMIRLLYKSSVCCTRRVKGRTFEDALVLESLTANEGPTLSTCECGEDRHWWTAGLGRRPVVGLFPHAERGSAIFLRQRQDINSAAGQTSLAEDQQSPPRMQ